MPTLSFMNIFLLPFSATIKISYNYSSIIACLTGPLTDPLSTPPSPSASPSTNFPLKLLCNLSLLKRDRDKFTFPMISLKFMEQQQRLSLCCFYILYGTTVCARIRALMAWKISLKILPLTSIDGSAHCSFLLPSQLTCTEYISCVDSK